MGYLVLRFSSTEGYTTGLRHLVLSDLSERQGMPSSWLYGTQLRWKTLVS